MLTPLKCIAGLLYTLIDLAADASGFAFLWLAAFARVRRFDEEPSGGTCEGVISTVFGCRGGRRIEAHLQIVSAALSLHLSPDTATHHKATPSFVRLIWLPML